MKETPPAAGQGETGVGTHGPLSKGMLGVAAVVVEAFFFGQIISHTSDLYLRNVCRKGVCAPSGEAHTDSTKPVGNPLSPRHRGDSSWPVGVLQGGFGNTVRLC